LAVSLASDNIEIFPQNSNKLRKNNISDPLRCSCKGKITMLLQMKVLLRKAQNQQNKGKVEQQKLNEVKERLYREL
jgi:hypothetical protein